MAPKGMGGFRGWGTSPLPSKGFAAMLGMRIRPFGPVSRAIAGLKQGVMKIYAHYH